MWNLPFWVKLDVLFVKISELYNIFKIILPVSLFNVWFADISVKAFITFLFNELSSKRVSVLFFGSNPSASI